LLEREWRSEKQAMNTDGMYLDTIIDNQYNVQALTDTGCLTTGLMSEQCAILRGVETVEITPRSLSQVVEPQEGQKRPEISRVARFLMDVRGYTMAIWAYVVPGQEDDLILGRAWMDRYDVRPSPAKDELLIRKWNLRVPVFGRRRPHAGCAQRITAATAARMTREPTVKAWRVTLEDVQRAIHKQKVLETLPQIERQLPDWLRDMASAFDRKTAEELPPHRPGVDHTINIKTDPSGNELPIPTTPLYHRPREELLIMRKTILDLLQQGYIRPSRSSAGAPVLFVKKADGGLRFCVDYRKLNSVTVNDAYPLPLMVETLRTVAQHKWVSKVDVISAFHRIRIRQGDEWKTAFHTRTGAYEWLVTPFGLTGAPATFQRYINWVLRDHLDKDATAFIDDVAVYSNGTYTEHQQLVREVIGSLHDAGLHLDVKKSQFAGKKLKFLGYVVIPGVGLEMDPEKVQAIRDWHPPTSVKGVRSFLGFTGFYREFVQYYSRIAAPLTGLTRKGRTFVWTEECQQAFEDLKEAAVTAPVLAAWVPGRPTRVEADSSGYVIGAALLQQAEDQAWHPVAYLSKKLTPAESHYPIHDKEMLAVISALREWRSELRGEKFVAFTDHRNLVYFQSRQQLSERQMRWAYELMGYDCTLTYRPGAHQVLADALSRREQDMPSDAEDQRLASRNIQVLEKTGEEWHVNPAWKREEPPPGDPERDMALDVRVGKGWLPDADGDLIGDPEWTGTREDIPSPFVGKELEELWAEGLRRNDRYWVLRQAIQTGERSLPKRWGLPISLSECDLDNEGRVRWRERVWIPFWEPLRTRLIQVTHDSPIGGHPGREGTRELIARQFYWPGLTADVRRFVRNCTVCRTSKAWRDEKKGLLKPLPVPQRPWSELSVDFVTGLPPSEGCETIMVVTDRLSKTVIFEPMAGTSTEEVARRLLEGVFRHHGLPTAIVSDRGPQFVSRFWRIICDHLGISRRLSTAFHPQTDGATERANQELEAFLRMFGTYEQDTWARTLPAAMLALNNRTNASTGMSAFFMTHGFHHEVVQSAPEHTEAADASPAALARAWLGQWSAATAHAQAAMAEAQEQQAEYANRKRSAADSFQPGDRVFLRLRHIRSERPSKKLDWLALPYTVVKLVGSHAVQLDTPPGIHPVFHVDLIRLAAADPLPSQVQRHIEPGPLLVNGETEWDVERISAHRRRGRGWQVRVHWTGYVTPSWEPLRDMAETAALQEYEDGLRDPPWPTVSWEEGGNVTGQGHEE
jgi:transposase InsO family protein